MLKGLKKEKERGGKKRKRDTERKRDWKKSVCVNGSSELEGELSF